MLPSTEPNRLTEPTKPAEPVMRSLLRTGEPSEPADTAAKAAADGPLPPAAWRRPKRAAAAWDSTKIVDQSLTLPSGGAPGRDGP